MSKNDLKLLAAVVGGGGGTRARVRLPYLGYIPHTFISGMYAQRTRYANFFI